MSNIYDLANELSRSLRELPEYKAVSESKKAVDADSEAKAVLNDYLVFQQELQSMAQTGQMPTQEMQDKMTSFGEKIQANEALSAFFNKQQQLSIYLADIERIIFEPVQELLKD
ncbi:MAG: YlbF/YmcA family competence regulator [Streptococcus sp.]|nr:YlbF/YmcA family competence regulator [Streptococcus sp.]